MFKWNDFGKQPGHHQIKNSNPHIWRRCVPKMEQTSPLTWGDLKILKPTELEFTNLAILKILSPKMSLNSWPHHQGLTCPPCFNWASVASAPRPRAASRTLKPWAHRCWACARPAGSDTETIFEGGETWGRQKHLKTIEKKQWNKTIPKKTITINNQQKQYKKTYKTQFLFGWSDWDLTGRCSV